MSSSLIPHDASLTPASFPPVQHRSGLYLLITVAFHCISARFLSHCPSPSLHPSRSFHFPHSPHSPGPCTERRRPSFLRSSSSSSNRRHRRSRGAGLRVGLGRAEAVGEGRPPVVQSQAQGEGGCQRRWSRWCARPHCRHSRRSREGARDCSGRGASSPMRCNRWGGRRERARDLGGKAGAGG